MYMNASNHDNVQSFLFWDNKHYLECNVFMHEHYWFKRYSVQITASDSVFHFFFLPEITAICLQ